MVDCATMAAHEPSIAIELLQAFVPACRETSVHFASDLAGIVDRVGAGELLPRVTRVGEAAHHDLPVRLQSDRLRLGFGVAAEQERRGTERRIRHPCFAEAKHLGIGTASPDAVLSN
jgi:hypothetical protein